MPDLLVSPKSLQMSCHEAKFDFTQTAPDIAADIGVILAATRDDNTHPAGDLLFLSAEIFLNRSFGELDGIILRFRSTAQRNLTSGLKHALPVLWEECIYALSRGCRMVHFVNQPGAGGSFAHLAAAGRISSHERLRLHESAQKTIDGLKD